MRTLFAVTFAVVTAAVLFAPTSPAHARKKTHKDEIRGFTCSVEDSFEQVPPKPGDDDLHIAAEWKDPSPKYRRFSGDQPTFKIIWTVKRKGDAPPEEVELPPWAKDLPPEQQEQIRTMLSAGTKQNLEGEVNQMMNWYKHLFGEFIPYAERLAEDDKPKYIKTASGHEARVLEVNYHRKRPKGTDATWWLWLATTGWETDTEVVELGFYGYVDVQFAKDFRKMFEATVKSFKLREFEEDEGDDESKYILDKDPEEVREKLTNFVNEKIIKGWKYKRTKNYLVVYDEDVNKKKIVDRVAKEIEALREQVYEELFPPDREFFDVSIVRVCETRDQYMAYGAPGGSAGYWSPYHEELVLYQDKNDKKDAIRVLYHEAFHQYIFYSVGEVSPHSWFNEGHGDFFSGHEYKSGKFKRDVFGWRTETAREAKRKWAEGIVQKDNIDAEAGPRTLHLREWLTWRQPEYYGRNDYKLPGGVNYALGWSFIYFLRTTKNEDYQRILPTYFNTLKSFVTQGREAREKALEDGLTGGGEGEGGPPPGGPTGDGAGEGDGGAGEGGTGEGGTGEGGTGEGGTAAGDLAEGGSKTSDVVARTEWHGASLEEATKGIDLDQLQKDWLEHSW